MNPLLNPKDVAKLLKLSVPFVYKAAETGRLPAIRIPYEGKTGKVKYITRFEPDEIARFMQDHRTGK